MILQGEVDHVLAVRAELRVAENVMLELGSVLSVDNHPPKLSAFREIGKPPTVGAKGWASHFLELGSLFAIEDEEVPLLVALGPVSKVLAVRAEKWPAHLLEVRSFFAIHDDRLALLVMFDPVHPMPTVRAENWLARMVELLLRPPTCPGVNQPTPILELCRFFPIEDEDFSVLVSLAAVS